MYKENFIIWASGIFFPQVCKTGSTVKKKNQYHPKKIILVEEKASVHDKSTQKPGKGGNFLTKNIIKNSFTCKGPTCLQPSLSPSISPCAANEDAKLHTWTDGCDELYPPHVGQAKLGETLSPGEWSSVSSPPHFYVEGMVSI